MSTRINGYSQAGQPITPTSTLSWPGWFYLPVLTAWVYLERDCSADFMLTCGYTRHSAHRPDSVTGGGRQGILTPTLLDNEREKVVRLTNELLAATRRNGEQTGDIATLRLELDSAKMQLETAQGKLAAITCIIRPDPKALTDEQQAPGTRRARRVTVARPIKWGASEPS